MLGAAPHRLLFFAGVSAVLCSIGWWALQLAAVRFGWAAWPQSAIPIGWAHAMLTQYGMLPLFIFGFLLTVFPRWLNQPTLPRSRYLLVGLSILGGYVIAHAGLLVSIWLVRLGFVLMLAGYIAALYSLGSVLFAARGRHDHAVSCLAALTLGSLGLAAFIGFLVGGPSSLALIAIKLGTFGFLLPIYVTVCHRMVPFFSGNVVKNYVVRRPTWSLPVVWVLLLARCVGEIASWPAWLVCTDTALALLFAWHAWAWQPWKARRPGLLAVLHLSFAWLPVAFTLFAIQDMAAVFAHATILGRAPLHVLTIGFFGSMLVAMVTRVTQGHSGRPLEMGVVPWVCFVLLQGVVLLRVGAELQQDTYLWLVISAAGWLVAFMPWVLRSAWIYLTPRADGQAG